MGGEKRKHECHFPFPLRIPWGPLISGGITPAFHELQSQHEVVDEDELH